MANGTVMPARPGLRKASPSSVTPCRPIAASPRQRGVLVEGDERAAPGAAGRRARRRASGRSAPTTVTSTSATTPAERLSSHQTWSDVRGGHATRLRQPDDGRAGAAAEELDVAVVADEQPAVAAQPAPRARAGRSAARPWRAPRPRARSGASAVAPIRPVQAGSPVAGSSRWCAGRAVGGAPEPGVDARRGDRAVAAGCSVSIVSPVSGWRTSIANGAPSPAPTRRSPPQSTAQRGAAASDARQQVGGEALAGAAGVEPQAGRAATMPAPSSTRDSRQRAAGRGARGRARRRRASASASGSSGARRRAVVARGLERADERRVDEAAGALRGPQPGARPPPAAAASRHRRRAGRR